MSNIKFGNLEIGDYGEGLPQAHYDFMDFKKKITFKVTAFLKRDSYVELIKDVYELCDKCIGESKKLIIEGVDLGDCWCIDITPSHTAPRRSTSDSLSITFVRVK